MSTFYYTIPDKTHARLIHHLQQKLELGGSMETNRSGELFISSATLGTANMVKFETSTINFHTHPKQVCWKRGLQPWRAFRQRHGADTKGKKARQQGSLGLLPRRCVHCEGASDGAGPSGNA